MHRDWCPRCQERVEPVVPHALPKATLGKRVLVLSAWLHEALGNTLSQIVEVFHFHVQRKRTAGGLVQMWYRLQAILYPWYAQLRQQALHAAVLFAEESGWRVNGTTHGRWCVTTHHVTFYMSNRLRRPHNDVCTFLEQAELPFDNNTAERAIRPAVIMHKNGSGNRSEQGADGQAVLRSVFRTFKQRGQAPIRTLVDARAMYLTTGPLPPLPEPITTSDG